MKNLITILLISFSYLAQSQVFNDDCAGTVNLGTAPLCQDIKFSNIGATASDIGTNNIPECFEDSPSSDVWFSFIADSKIINYTITIEGDNSNGNPLTNIQAGLYRGYCPDNIFALNTCAKGEFGATSLSFDVSNLTPNDLYYIRIDNYSGSNFEGEFNVCISEQDIEYTLSNDGSTECTGVLYDTGGPNGDYGSNEDNTFTICPGSNNQCIEFNIEYYNIEQGIGNTGDKIIFYNGENVNAPVINQIAGNGINGNGSVCYTIYGEKCLTVRMITDNNVNLDGFKASWNCSNVKCELPETIQIDSIINEKSIVNNLSSSLVDIKVTGISCDKGAVGVFSKGNNSDLGLDKGILITTGKAELALGPNTSVGAGFAHISDGDSDLDILSQLYGSDLLSNDACVIEVEAFVKANELNFQFLFGSEEYPEYESDDFNDIFALFIEGPGITDGIPELNGKKNLALIPKSNIPIEINSVNSKSNWEYFRNNQSGLSSEYDGYVVDYLGSKKSLTASAQVIPCNTYKLKFAIADRNDFIFDSGVFISELRNNVPEISLATSFGFDYLLEKCTDGQELIVINIDNPQEKPLQFVPQLGGTAINGVDYILDLPDTITFEPGQTLLTFPITVLSDNISEGTETIEILFQNDFGCEVVDITSITIEIREDIEVVAQGGEDVVYICKGTPFELFAEGATSYSWTPATNLSDSNINNPIILDPQIQQTYIVTGSIDPFTNAECMDVDTITIIPVDPEIVISSSDELMFCFGDSINVEIINNVGNTNINWENLNIGVQNPNSNLTVIKPTISSLDLIPYVANITLNGCAASDTLFLRVDPYLFPEILVTDTTICEGYPLLLAGPGDPLTTYEWTPSDYLSDANIANPIATATEDITYQLVATSATEICSDSIEINLVVQANKVEIIGQDTVFMCLGDSISFATNSTSEGLNLSWAPQEIVNVPDSSIVTYYPTFSQYAYVTMDYDGCIAHDSVWMQVDSLPSMKFEIIQDKPDYCIGEVITIVSPGYDDEHFPNIEFQWDPAPGIISDLDNWNLAIVAADTAIFRRITTNGACVDTIEREIIVKNPLAEIMVSDTSVLCPFTPVQLLLTSESKLEDIKWEPGSPELSCDDCPNPIATVGATTTVSVSMMADGCPVTASAEIKVAELFLAIGFSEPFVCPGSPVQLTLQSNGTITDIDWKPKNILSCGDCLSPIAVTDVSTNLEVTAKIDGCEYGTSNTLVIDNNIRTAMLAIEPNDTVPAGGEITLIVVPEPSFGPNTTYEWFINDVSQGLKESSFITTQNDTVFTIYRVTITDENGCIWSATNKAIGAFPTFGLPNAFTPNGDELNDFFRLVPLKKADLDNWELTRFDIFNRWGEKVFSCEDKQCALDEGWDGRINNVLAPAGVYIYGVQVEIANGDKLNFKGDVTLLR